MDRDGANFFLDYVLPCLWAFLACVGFTLVFNIHGVGKADLRLQGRTGLAGVSAGGQQHRGRIPGCGGHRRLSEIMARLRRPVTGYLLVALLPLVPGEVSITP